LKISASYPARQSEIVVYNISFCSSVFHYMALKTNMYLAAGRLIDLPFVILAA